MLTQWCEHIWCSSISLCVYVHTHWSCAGLAAGKSVRSHLCIRTSPTCLHVVMTSVTTYADDADFQHGSSFVSKEASPKVPADSLHQRLSTDCSLSCPQYCSASRSSATLMNFHQSGFEAVVVCRHLTVWITFKTVSHRSLDQICKYQLSCVCVSSSCFLSSMPKKDLGKQSWTRCMSVFANCSPQNRKTRIINHLRSSSELSASFEIKNKLVLKGRTVSKACRVISQLAKNTMWEHVFNIKQVMLLLVWLQL